MQRIKIDQDIQPLSEVRTGIANFIKQVHDTKTGDYHPAW